MNHATLNNPPMLNKLLQRQIRKHLTDDLLKNEAVKQFIDAVNQSYLAYERDHTLSEHAFKLSEKEFIAMNQRLRREIDLNRQGIRNLRETIRIAGTEAEADQVHLDEDNLINLSEYLKEQIHLRKAVEHELEESRTHHATTANRLKQLIANLHNGIMVGDEHGKTAFVNQRFCEMFGIPLSPDEIAGMDCTHVAAQSKDIFNEPEKFLQRTDELLAQRQLTVDDELELKDGRVFQRDYVPIHIDGEYKGHLWKYRDVTQEKIDKKKLEHLSLVASTNENGVFFTNPDGTIFWTNKGFSRLTGYEEHEIIGKTPLELCKGPLTNRDDLRSMLDAFYAGKTFEIEVVHYRKDGTWFWGRERGQSILDEKGNVLEYFAMVEDVSTIKEKEHALKLSEEKYRGIIANMNMGILEVNNHDQIVYANHSFCEMSGYSSRELIGKHARELFLRGENAELMKEKDQLREEGVSDVYEMAVKNKRGEAKWWLISGAPMYDERGNKTGSIGIHLDITLQKELEVQLMQAKAEAEESAKAKEVFLANMSHEIRTPMNGIIGMTRQLYKTGINEQQKFYLDTISTASENLMVILNDILDFSKIESGKLYLEHVGFRLEETLGNSIRVLTPRAEEKGIALKTVIDEGITPVMIGDPHRLNQLFLNLVGNAVKFTEKGSVTVKCDLESEQGATQQVRFSVIDTGIGIAPEYLERMFEKFTQEDKSTARRFGGTGLGMSISKHLVELMGGTIDVQSAKNEGTTVSFSIPLQKGTVHDIPPATAAAITDFSILGDKRILLVEDNELNQLVVTSSLDLFGLKTVTAGNGIEALEALKNEQFDLVLMDIQMPDMDGYEATRILRKELRLGIPVIALTANAIKGENEKCLKAGMTDFLSKPFEENDLLAVLMKYLGEGKAGGIPAHGPARKNNRRREVGFSLDKLREISRGNDQFLVKMIGIFRRQSSEVLADMRNAHGKKDFDRLRKLAHKLKPSLDNLEISGFAREIRELEKWDEKTSNNEQIQELLDRLEQVLTEVQQGLDKEMSEFSGKA